MLSRHLTLPPAEDMGQKKNRIDSSCLRPSRPPNAFMIYRKKKNRQIQMQFPHLKQKEISRVVSDMWKKESDHIKLECKLESEIGFIKRRDEDPRYAYVQSEKSNRVQNENPRPRKYLDGIIFESVVNDNASVEDKMFECFCENYENSQIPVQPLPIPEETGSEDIYEALKSYSKKKIISE